MKIQSITQKGEFIKFPLQKERYDEQRIFFKENYGKDLPFRHEIPFSYKQIFYVLTSHVEVEVTSDLYIDTFYFEPGFVWDIMSIPLPIRGKRPWWLLFLVKFPDNDDPRGYIPSACHDGLGAGRLLEEQILEEGCSRPAPTKSAWKEGNEYFKKLCIFEGIKKVVANFLKLGVNTRSVGWKMYRDGRGYEYLVRCKMKRVVR